MRDPVLWRAVFGSMTRKEAQQANEKADRVRYARLKATGMLEKSMAAESFSSTPTGRDVLLAKAGDMIRMKTMQQLGMTTR